MSRSAVEIRVGGQAYKVVASTTESEVRQLAAEVERRLDGVRSGKPATPHHLVLVAIQLAHELKVATLRHTLQEQATRQALVQILDELDKALLGVDQISSQPCDEKATR